MISKHFKNPLLPRLRCSTGEHASPVPRGKGHSGSSSCLLAALIIAGATASAGDEPGARTLQQQQLQRQQQQEALQLRMQQQQSATQSPPRDASQRQSLELLQRDQVRRQQELHYRQGGEATAPRQLEDAASRRARDDIHRMKTKEQGESLLRRSEAEQKKK